MKWILQATRVAWRINGTFLCDKDVEWADTTREDIALYFFPERVNALVEKCAKCGRAVGYSEDQSPPF